MKRIICIIAIFVMLASLTACDGVSIQINIGGKETTAPTAPDTSAASTAPKMTADPTDPAETAASTAPKETAASTVGAVATEPEERDPTPVTTEKPEITLSPEEILWEKIAGCWIGDDGRFAYFTYADGIPAFLGGFWENPQPYRRDPATVSGLYQHSSGMYTMNLTYPPVSGDAADSLDLKELRYTMMVDISGLDHGTITVEAPDDTLRTYTFGGYSYDDAYDASHNVQYATFAQMQEFWSWLTGYWNSDDGRFVCFDQKDSNSLIFMEGIWDSGSRGWADFEKAMSGSMDLPTEFVIYYPPVSNELDGDLPAEYVRVFVDWMEMETHGHIYVRMGGNGEWIKYTFAGYTEAEAYPNS